MKAFKTITAITVAILLAGCSNGTAQAASVSTSVSPDEDPYKVVKDTSEASDEADVELDAGTLIGLHENGIYKFRGIPYATAERFQDPVPVTSYENGYQLALSYGSVSPQDRTLSANGAVNSAEYMTPSNGTADMVGNENCQNLNVWTNDLSGRKPVIVFFHGGGVSNGAASELSYYDGEYMAETQDVVFVSINHRLNILGFLDLSAYGEKYANSGIEGIEDCVEGLKWVHNNIDKFGGDPDNVTIVGQSGGGTKVTTLACMSDTVDLFKKVVVMSGDYAETPQSSGLDATQKLVDSLDVSDDQVINTLTNMDYDLLYAAAEQAEWYPTIHYGIGTFETPLFDEDGNMNKYAAARTWMIGSAYSESSDNNYPKIYMHMDGYRLDEISDDDAKERLKDMYGDDSDAIIEEYANAYPDKPLAEALFLDMWQRPQFTDTENSDLLKTANAGAVIYNYVSAYTQPFWGGAVMYHTSDIPYWFDSIDEAEYLIYGDEANAHKVAHTMSSALASFAADGDPSTDDLVWKPYTADDRETMIFDVNSECRQDPDTKLFSLIRDAQAKQNNTRN